MYSQQLKSRFQWRFIISGGTLMTIITTVKSIMVGDGIYFWEFLLKCAGAMEKITAGMT